jgi:hypothetical protein
MRKAIADDAVSIDDGGVRPKIERMTILVERKVWRRPRLANRTKRSTDLTPEEPANVRRALRFLRQRFGSWRASPLAIDAELGDAAKPGLRAHLERGAGAPRGQVVMRSAEGRAQAGVAPVGSVSALRRSSSIEKSSSTCVTQWLTSGHGAGGHHHPASVQAHSTHWTLQLEPRSTHSS